MTPLSVPASSFAARGRAHSACGTRGPVRSLSRRDTSAARPRRFSTTSWAPTNVRARNCLCAPAPTAAGSTPPQPPSPFTRLPFELVFRILSLAACSCRSSALSISLVSRVARALALAPLLRTRALRTGGAALAFAERAGSASALTPLGAGLRALWLSDTRAWPAGAVRGAVRACDALEALALTRLEALAPNDVNAPSGDDENGAPLFTGERPLALTLVGHTAPEDVRAFAARDPAGAAALARRVTMLRVMKLRCPVRGRSAQPGVGDGHEGDDEDTGGVRALLALCPNVCTLAIPAAHVLGQGIAETTCCEDGAGEEAPWKEELAVLRGWADAAGAGALREIELLVDGDKKTRSGCWTSAGEDSQSEWTVRTVQWPRNVDLAREAWMEAAA
jgi:hypothetical protein